jgi:uncharacterized PurR-regulated membrane protein YhhQ (DUF165 family)
MVGVIFCSSCFLTTDSSVESYGIREAKFHIACFYCSADSTAVPVLPGSTG